MKYIKYHFFTEDSTTHKITDSIIESDSTSIIPCLIKFGNGEFTVTTAYYEMLVDGTKMLHYNCYIRK
jgi:hypothetical protein